MRPHATNQARAKIDKNQQRPAVEIASVDMKTHRRSSTNASAIENGYATSRKRGRDNSGSSGIPLHRGNRNAAIAYSASPRIRRVTNIGRSARATTAEATA